MTREERNTLLADLRAAGVKMASFYENGIPMSVELFPAELPAVVMANEDKPLPRPKRTLDERLYGPLGISEGQPKPGGEG